MTANNTKYEWYGISARVRGASHKRSDLPNQDAIHWTPESKTGVPLIVAISDGHGSRKYFRSQHGSDIAVHIAVTTLQRFIDDQSPTTSLTQMRQIADVFVPQSLIRDWRAAVDEHVQRHPFTDKERDNLIAADGIAAWESVERNKYLAYGATLLGVLVTDRFILYMQLGDGDILIVNSLGETTRPFAHDARLMANETTSLCSSNAVNEVQVTLVPMEVPPEMVLVATDGYANSFPSEEGFRKLGSDYLQMLKMHGKEAVQNQLERFLWLASHDGSGDDITLGIIKRATESDFDTQKRNNEELRQQVVRLQQQIDRQQQAVEQQDITRLALRQELVAALAQEAAAREQVTTHLRTSTEEQVAAREQAIVEMQAALDGKVSHSKFQQVVEAEVLARTELRHDLERSIDSKADLATIQQMILTELEKRSVEDLRARLSRLKVGVIISALLAVSAMVMSITLFLP